VGIQDDDDEQVDDEDEQVDDEDNQVVVVHEEEEILVVGRLLLKLEGTVESVDREASFPIFCNS